MSEPTREQECAIDGLARYYAHVMAERLPPTGAQLYLVRCYDEYESGQWKEVSAVYVYADGHTKQRTPAELAEAGIPATYRPTQEERGVA